MQAASLIQHYNRLNGKSITRTKLKDFRADIQRYLDSVGTGPFVPDLVGIAKRIAKVLATDADIIDRIELVPIDVRSPKEGEILRVSKGFDEDSQQSTVNSGQSTVDKDVVAVNFAINNIHTDTKRFQNRTDAFSEASADSVAKNYDPNKFDPIVVWQDPKAKKLFVLSGHSRYEGMKRRGAKAIPVRYFKGTEEEAIKFAKVEANRAANVESLVEDLGAYKLMRDGDKARDIKAATKTELQRIFKGKVGKLEAYSNLNANGLFIQSLSQSNTTNYPYLERNAQWVGIVRNMYPAISHTGEDNIFHFFYSDKAGRNIKLSKDDFFGMVKKKVNGLRKDESVLFPECSADGCKATVDREADPQKGEAFKRLREINEALDTIREKLTSKDATVRVTTDEEKKYLRTTADKLEEEKQRINRDLDVIDKSQASLFGVKKSKRKNFKAKRRGKLKGPQYDAFDIKQVAPTKGPLNRLQRAALEDAIKAGRTPKVNLKAKMNAKQKPAPLFEEPVNDPKQASLFGSKKVKTQNIASLGFVTADNAPDKPADLFTLPGEVGKLLGNLQRYKMEIVIAGETHSSKSQLGMQIANAFASIGDDVAWIDWEQGGLQSVHTQKSIERNVSPENKKRIHVSGDVPRTLDAVKSLTKEFKVIALDSGSKIDEVTNAWIDTLREEFPQTVWIIMMQQNSKGGTRGGTSAEFDAPIVIKTYRPDETDFAKNYATMFKNRGNKTGMNYNISKKKIATSNDQPTTINEKKAA